MSTPPSRSQLPMEMGRVHGYSHGLPMGPGQSDYSQLLRHVATGLEAQSPQSHCVAIIHSSELNDFGDWPTLTLYFESHTAGIEHDHDGA